MKVIEFTKYGSADVLQFKEIKKPVPKDNEVLIKIFATTVTTADCNMRSFTVPLGFWLIGRLAFGLLKPKKTILGTEFSGEIESIGKNVKAFNKKDQVYGTTGARFGAYSEYICLPEESVIVKKAENISYENAAAIPFSALTALFFLRDKGKIQNGQKILIYGASGGVGTTAIQLAKYYGAEVTSVCSTTNLKLVKSLGSDNVIDYTKEDFTKNGRTYDIILDIPGKSSFSKCKNSLKKDGLYLLVTAGLPQFIQMLWTSIVGRKKIISGMAPERIKDLIFLNELIKTDKIKSVIDRCYPFERIIDAHNYVDKGHKKGSVVITIKQNTES